MSLILNIDTAAGPAHVSLARNGILLQQLSNESQKDHAAFLQVAVQQLMKETGLQLKDIDAVAFTAGPGSYTGLRVGMASAKGLCYALNKPLIALNTLEVWTASAIRHLQKQGAADPKLLYCPMIDARRMEVFTAIYDIAYSPVLSPLPLVLKAQSFEAELLKDRIVFFGSGAKKWQDLCRQPKALFTEVSILPEAMAERADHYYNRQVFAELAYSEPLYLKDFQTVIK